MKKLGSFGILCKVRNFLVFQVSEKFTVKVCCLAEEALSPSMAPWQLPTTHMIFDCHPYSLDSLASLPVHVLILPK